MFIRCGQCLAARKPFFVILILAVCFTATVAFAAFTSELIINGTATIVGKPFKFEIFDMESNQNSLISASAVSGSAEASDLVFTDLGDGKIGATYSVKFYKSGDSVSYQFTLNNTGGVPAYLQRVEIKGISLPEGATTLDGLVSSLELKEFDRTVTSNAGELNEYAATASDYIAAGESLTCILSIKVDENAQIFNNGGNLELVLGGINLVWSSAPAA